MKHSLACLRYVYWNRGHLIPACVIYSRTQCDEVPRDWESVLLLMGIGYIGVLFHTFYYYYFTIILGSLLYRGLFIRVPLCSSRSAENKCIISTCLPSSVCVVSFHWSSVSSRSCEQSKFMSVIESLWVSQLHALFSLWSTL